MDIPLLSIPSPLGTELEGKGSSRLLTPVIGVHKTPKNLKENLTAENEMEAPHLQDICFLTYLSVGLTRVPPTPGPGQGSCPGVPEEPLVGAQ